MDANEFLATQFETHRSHLRAVAYRMLGSASEADDVVQETWLRLVGADTTAVGNLAGWLTTVVARVCLDTLRSRKTRAEESLETDEGAVDAMPAHTTGPEQEVLLADAVGPALLVVLDTLAPAERLAFVLHDLFGVSFDDIAPIVGKNSAAARQLASRARRRVQGADAVSNPDIDHRKKIVDAFLAASRNGDFAALLELLDPDVVLRADATAVLSAKGKQAEGAPQFAPEMHGAHAVAEVFRGRARAARVALLDGAVGAVFALAGKPKAAFAFTLAGGRVIGIEVIADPARLDATKVEMFT